MGVNLSLPSGLYPFMQATQLWPALLLGIFLCTCDRAPQDAPVSYEGKFYDLAGYMDAEMARLAVAHPTADKTIVLNGTEESKRGVAIDYAADLRLFRQADINKPAWEDKYRTETEALSAGHRRTHYVATDSSLVVRRITVEEDQGETTEIRIERRTGNVLSDGRHELTYAPARGYRVVTEQTNRFGDDVDATVVVRW